MKQTIEIEHSMLETVRDALVAILQGNKFSGNVQMKVFRNRQKIIDAWKPIAENRNNLVEKYAGENGTISPDHDSWDEFVEEWRPIAGSLAEINIEPILWEELYEKGDPSFEGSSLQLLLDYGLIVEELENEESKEEDEESEEDDEE